MHRSPSFAEAAGDSRALSRSSPWPLIAVCVGYFMVILDSNAYLRT